MNDFRDNERHVSQISALHLLQKLGYKLLSKSELDRERRGKLGLWRQQHGERRRQLGLWRQQQCER